MLSGPFTVVEAKQRFSRFPVPKPLRVSDAMGDGSEQIYGLHPVSACRIKVFPELDHTVQSLYNLKLKCNVAYAKSLALAGVIERNQAWNMNTVHSCCCRLRRPLRCSLQAVRTAPALSMPS